MASVDNKIFLDFGWEGPNRWNGGSSGDGYDIRSVDLVFKDAKSEISVDLPENIEPDIAQAFPFRKCKYETKLDSEGRMVKVQAEETFPDQLKVTLEQIQQLTIRILKKNSSMVSDSSTEDVILRRLPKLEVGRTYRLVVRALWDPYGLHFCASLQKKRTEEERTAEREAIEAERKATEEYRKGQVEGCIIS